MGGWVVECSIKQQLTPSRSNYYRYPALLPSSAFLPLAAHLLAVLNTNSHELEELGPGSGLFLKACLFEHSCVPNCAFA